jgi:hypothetical protein
VRLPTTRDQHEFCRVDGWTPDRESGHIIYRKTLATGDVLSFPVSHGEKPIRNPDLFAYICREELRCTPSQFWDAVDHGIPVPRPQPEEAPPEDPIPYGLIQVLRALGHSEERIRQLRTKAEALELLNQGPAT